MSRSGWPVRRRWWSIAAVGLIAGAGVSAEEVVIDPAGPNAIAFDPQPARYVRLVIAASSGGQPGLDELEVYGPGADDNLALAKTGARATASSCLPGYAIHRVAHLNDGRYGNDWSWIAAGERDEWAQIELPAPTVVSRIVFSRDRDGRYADRVPLDVAVLLSSDGREWIVVARVAGSLAAPSARYRGAGPQTLAFRQEHARWVRLVILGTGDGAPPALDELEVYGPEPGVNLAAGAAATVSSLAAGSATALTDGRYGAHDGWTAAGPAEEWAQVELPGRVEVNRVMFSRDRTGRAGDGVPAAIELQISLDGRRWKTVAERGRGLVPSPPTLPAGRAAALTDLTVPRTDSLGYANLALLPDARPAASSLLPGYPDKHTIPHLCDGRYGNAHSWISGGEPSWAEIDLGAAFWVYKVAFGSDSSGQYADRAAVAFEVQTATTQEPTPDWHTVVRRDHGPPLQVRTEFAFQPVRARWVRVAIAATAGGQVRIDELEVYGDREPLDPARTGPLPPHPPARGERDDGALRDAFLAEEYAWLKTYGRADLDPRLTDYVRVWNYPEHVPDDRLPLGPLASEPLLDGRLDDPAWRGASRGVVRVAYPERFERSPLVEQALYVGRRGGYLYLAILADRLLSAHLAVVSSLDWQGCGAVVIDGDRLVFRTWKRDDGDERVAPDETRPVEGQVDTAAGIVELRLPTDWFPRAERIGWRIGLGLGGRHTRVEGRPIVLLPSALALAQVPTAAGFQVRLAAAEPVQLTGSLGPIALAAGEERSVDVSGAPGPLGPEAEVAVEEGGRRYALHLWRYDPAVRALALFAELLERLERRGLEVSVERAELARLQAAPAEGEQAVRERLFAIRSAKRRLFLRDPDLAPAERILCVKRHNFEPSHNYSDLLDSAGGPGGAVVVVSIPRGEGRLLPERAETRVLFEAGDGIARDPRADFSGERIYFGYCAAKGDYYHLYRIGADGSGLAQLTDGPFHDFYPCPLPDGGLAFMSTRCRARFLCWRPQAFVLFRMEPDGGDIRPLSYANLSEWAPALMRDGRLLWTRSEYQDKGADFGHTLWAIRPDGTHPELVFGNDIIQPNGYANGREVPGTSEICATLISHFGDLNGPIALLDPSRGRSNPDAIVSLTPEVPWPGMWPYEECFRDPEPISRDLILCSHAPGRRFGLWVIDRYGHREVLYQDPTISVLCPTPLASRPAPPVLTPHQPALGDEGEFFLADVYQGLSPKVPRGAVKWLRICQEVRADLERLETGEYRRDHEPFMDWYATPVHLVSGPYGWPSYVAKASWGLVPVEPDGSAHFVAPAGKVLYFEVLDERYTEIQRMRSVVQLQPGEKRSCIGCHEPREAAPPVRAPVARQPRRPVRADWEGRPFDYQAVVQPVLDRHCVSCHAGDGADGLDLTGRLDAAKVPASYRTLVGGGLVHYFDWSYNPGGTEKAEPLTFGTRRSRLWEVLDGGHHEVDLSLDETLRLKTWIDLNCPLWPDYQLRERRPAGLAQVTRSE